MTVGGLHTDPILVGLLPLVGSCLLVGLVVWRQGRLYSVPMLAGGVVGGLLAHIGIPPVGFALGFFAGTVVGGINLILVKLDKRV